MAFLSFPTDLKTQTVFFKLKQDMMESPHELFVDFLPGDGGLNGHDSSYHV